MCTTFTSIANWECFKYFCMRSICRVFLTEASSLRPFYWFECSDDRSIYLGSSNGKYFDFGYSSRATTSASASTPIDPILMGRELEDFELKQKLSIHGSGVVNARTVTNGIRDRYEIAPPRDGLNALPLIAVLPMQPNRYPMTTKRPKPTDIVLPPAHAPFGTLFYLKQRGEKEPFVLTSARDRYDTFSTLVVPFGSFDLCVFMYTDSLKMRFWPRNETSLTTLPTCSGEELSWAFFFGADPTDLAG